MERGRSWIHRMRQKRSAAGLPALRGGGIEVPCKGREFPIGANHKQVILLWNASAIVDLLSDQHKDSAAALLVVPLQCASPDIVVCDHEGIDSLPNGCSGQIQMASRAIGVSSVHVNIQDDFMHQRSLLELVDDFLRRQV